MFSSIEPNYLKMSLLQEYQHSVLSHELPLTKICQKLYQFLLKNVLPFYVQRTVQGDPGAVASKSLVQGEFLKIQILGPHCRSTELEYTEMLEFIF